MFLERYEKYIEAEPNSGCWIWVGGSDSKGYGFAPLGRRGRRRMAHRLSYECFIGAIPTGHFVCHRCDNPPCVNPVHLFAGTQSDNMRDCVAKGRIDYANGRPRGEGHGRAKLTDEAVREIRALYASTSTRELAGRYGVSMVMIGNVVKRRNWTHV